MVKYRSNHQSCCKRKIFLKTSQNLQESICARDFSPGVFLGVLWSCKKHLFYRKSPDDWFRKYYSKIRDRSICRDLKFLQLIKVVLWKESPRNAVQPFSESLPAAIIVKCLYVGNGLENTWHRVYSSKICRLESYFLGYLVTYFQLILSFILYFSFQSMFHVKVFCSILYLWPNYIIKDKK